jgi:Flp pilus assembly protein TadG
MAQPRDQRGTVTAEAALVLPLIAAFCLGLIWMVSVGIDQVRVVDAARDAARSIARGDDPGMAAAAARRTAPAGSRVTFQESGATATANVSARVSAPHWLLVPLPSVMVESTATVEVEVDSDASPHP